MNEDIVELQTRLSFQEDTIMELSEIIVRQQREVERLKLDVSTLQRQIRMAMEYEKPDETPPPHY